MHVYMNFKLEHSLRAQWEVRKGPEFMADDKKNYIYIKI